MAEKEMSFLEHLEDLRWHLLRSIVAILIAALAAFLAKNFVFDVLLFGQKNRFFNYKLLCQASIFLALMIAFALVNCLFEFRAVPWLVSFQHIFGRHTLGFVVHFLM